MQFSNESAWNECVNANQDEYGSAVMRYAKAWAEKMEILMGDGATIESCAKKSSHDADIEGITGYMYGCAVLILAACWKHGEELRRWHNLYIQIGTEGERANESGGVLNPALIHVE